MQMVRDLVLKATRSMEWMFWQSVSTVVPTGEPSSAQTRATDQRPSPRDFTSPAPAATTEPKIL